MATAKGRIQGYGSATLSQHVLMVGFNHPLSSKVRIEAYDGSGSFPSVGSALTTGNDVFGLGAGEQSMIGAHEIGNAKAASTSWMPTTPNANTASVNLLEGLTSYVTQFSATLNAVGGGSLHYNLQMRIPASMQTDSTTSWDLLFRYTFTSTTPTVGFWYNDATNSGLPGTPVWATVQLETASNVRGIRHARRGHSISDTTFLANIPSTGQEKTGEGWVTN